MKKCFWKCSVVYVLSFYLLSFNFNFLSFYVLSLTPYSLPSVLKNSIILQIVGQCMCMCVWCVCLLLTAHGSPLISCTHPISSQLPPKIPFYSLLFSLFSTKKVDSRKVQFILNDRLIIRFPSVKERKR
jgi:hypothetical protein